MKEAEIRPKEIFDEFLRLCALDVESFFSRVNCQRIPCPSCGAWGKFSFHKCGFFYEECQQCLTLYVSPRPESGAFRDYYSDSPSTKFWATTFYPLTEKERREKIWRERSLLVAEKNAAFCNADTVVDIGAGFGVFAEEMARISKVNIIAIEPSRHLADICGKKGIQVVQKFLEDITADDIGGTRRFFTSFELFEHLHNPVGFLKAQLSIMRKDDVFLFTTLSSTGADIRVLWENSPSVSPPHHINFFNPYSISQLLENSGFELLEVSTPGKLDIDILMNNKDHISDRFWSSFLRCSDENACDVMQDFIAKNLLSSHMSVICRKSARQEDKS